MSVPISSFLVSVPLRENAGSKSKVQLEQRGGQDPTNYQFYTMTAMNVKVTSRPRPPRDLTIDGSQASKQASKSQPQMTMKAMEVV